MKILLVVPMVPRADGAGAIPMLLQAQLSGLSKRHEVTLISSVGDDPGDAEAAAALQEAGIDAHFADRRLPPTASLRNRRRARLLGTWASTRWPWRTVWFASPGVQAIIDRQTAARRFDVIAAEDTSMSVFRLPSNVPAVLTEHEAFRAAASAWRTGPLTEQPRQLLAKLDWDRWGEFQRQSWRRFGLIQVYSEGDAGEIAASEPEVASRVRVNPFGIELPAALDPALEDGQTLLFVGNFTHPPNRDAALWLSEQIMPALRHLHPGVRLRLVGNSPPREVLDLAAEDVEVVADAPSIEPHLAAAAVVLAPVRTGGGMRMKVLEALARRKAVVTTRRGSEGYTGFEPALPFVVADDPEEIATAAAALLADPERRRQLAARGREFVERHYTPGAWAERLERVYEEAIAAGPLSR